MKDNTFEDMDIEVTETIEFKDKKLNDLVEDYKDEKITDEEFKIKLAKIIKSKKQRNEALDVIDENINGKKSYIQSFGDVCDVSDIEKKLKVDQTIRDHIVDLVVKNKVKYPNN
jgi:hypothetical protein